MIYGEFQLEEREGTIRLLVLMPGIVTMDVQGAYDLAHCLIEEAGKVRRRTARRIDFRDDKKDG